MKNILADSTARAQRLGSMHHSAQSQKGVLLIVTLIVLLVISSIAALSIKGAGSTEVVANNTRTQALAMQAAEAALSYCEIGAINFNITANAKTITSVVSTHSLAILAPPVTGTTPTWQDLSAWQGSTPTAATISLAALDALGSASVTTGSSTFASVYKRDPDCIAQYADTARTMVWVTARGFGPEVAAAASVGETPFGTEVFLQSTLRLPLPP